MQRVKRFRPSTPRICKRLLSINQLVRSPALERERHNVFTDAREIADEAWDDPRKGSLQHKEVGIKANIVRKDALSSAASKTLSGYRSPFDATVVRLLRENGAYMPTGMNMDEFGMGSHSQYSASGPVLGRYSRGGKPLSPGGSSGGGAVAVGCCSMRAALGTDTGGSVRLPAAYNEVIGFKPSYGLISRWGVIQYANSLDTVGIFARTVREVQDVFEVLNVHDTKDPTSLSATVRQRLAATPWLPKSQPLRIGIPLEYNIAELSPAIRASYTQLLLALQSQGNILQPVSLPSTRAALSAYYILAPAEAASNLAKYDGIRYGRRTNESDASPNAPQPLPLYAQTRVESFGPEVQRRILLGAYTLSASAQENYFIQAQKVRRLVQDEFNGVFRLPNPLLSSESQPTPSSSPKVDVLITPTTPTLPPTIESLQTRSAVENYMNDIFTVPASLAGLPALNVPVGLTLEHRREREESDIQSAGMQIIGQFGDDETVLRAGELVNTIGFNLHSHVPV